jgi:HAD superfamily hydrolase (TIGR01484 family)
MKPLDAMPADALAAMRGLLFDLDDTILTNGVLSRAAYSALWDLHDSGLRLVVVTGRPAGWGAVLVRQWPVDAVLAETGAVRLWRDGPAVILEDRCPAEVRRARRARLAALVAEVRARVPEVRLADDVDARVSDVAWDVGERVRVPEDRVALVREAIQAAGARTTRSSVHLHATFDGDDKATGALRLLQERFGEDPGAARFRWGFVGDSGNDRACFGAFEHTFGVANVRAHLPALPIPPRWVTPSPMGAGFAELARAILRARAALNDAPRRST